MTYGRELTYYTSFDSPIGEIFIASTSHGICKVSLGTSEDKFIASIDAVRDERRFKRLLHELDQYFEALQVELDFSVDLTGLTPFRKRVLMAVKKVPYGEVRSYKEIARSIGNPKAARAVGQVNANNPVPLIIPCHRIIGSDGSLVGFGSGIDIKRYLLQLEGVL